MAFQSWDQVNQAAENYSPGAYTPPPPTTFMGKVGQFIHNDITQPIGQTFQSGMQQAGQGLEEVRQGGTNPFSDLGHLAQGVGRLGSGIATAVTSPIAGPLSKPTHAVLNPIVNAISDNPAVQQFANSGLGKATATGAENIANLSNIAGTIGAGMELQPKISNIFQRTPKSIMNPADVVNAHPDVQEARAGLAEAQGNLIESESAFKTAQQARANAAQPAVEGTTQFQQGVKQGESALGAKFGQAGLNIKNTDSNLKMNWSNQMIQDLNAVKEDRQFALPDYMNKENMPTPSVGGKELDLSKMNPKMAEQIQKATGQMQGETAVSTDPVQTQEIIKQLNSKMYKEMADGTVQVDQRVADLVNNVKQQAQSTFGHVVDSNGESVWNKAYQDYAQGAKTTEDLKTLLGFKGGQNLMNVSPNKLLGNILKLGQTPEGKIQLQNAVDEFKTQTGIDLTNPTQAVHQILDREMQLEEAGGNLKESQKGLTASQKNLSATQRKITAHMEAEAAKGSYLHQMVKGMISPQRLGGRLAWGVMGIGIVYPAIRAITKSLTGK